MHSTKLPSSGLCHKIRRLNLQHKSNKSIFCDFSVFVSVDLDSADS